MVCFFHRTKSHSGLANSERLADPTMNGFVYVMVRHDGIRKVGLTVDLHSRRIQCSVQQGGRFEIERSWCMEYPHAVELEREVHLALRPERVIEPSREELYDLPLEYLSSRIEGAMFMINNGFLVPHAVYHRGWRKPSKLSVSDDQIRAAIPLGTVEGARKVKLSISTFIRRRRAIEEVAADAKQS